MYFGVIVFNSRTAIAVAIISVLLVFYFVRFLLRPYDVTTTFCSFVHAISSETRAWRQFSLLVERVFCSIAWLIAALIFSAGYCSAPNFSLTSSNFFSLYPFCRFFDILREIFYFSRLVLLFCHSAQSPLKQHLLSKAIQNEQSQYKNLKSEIETG